VVSSNDVIVSPIQTAVNVSGGSLLTTVQKVSVTVRSATQQFTVNTTGPNKIVELSKQGPPGKDGLSGLTENVIFEATSTAGTLAVGDMVQPDVSLNRGVKIIADNKEDWAAIGIVTEVEASGDCKVLYIGFSNFVVTGFTRGQRAWIGTAGGPQSSPVTDGWLQEIGYCYQDTFLFVDFSKTRLKRNPF